MQIIKVDLLDGEEVSIVVSSAVDAERVRRFVSDAYKNIEHLESVDAIKGE